MPMDTGTIQVRIHELRQLFNSIDPSPFRERDLDPDCEEFIVSWARELPPDRPLRVEVRIDREQPPADLLAAVEPAVRSHFAREASLQELRRRRLVREGRLSLAIGLATLVLCIGAATLVPTATLGTPGEILRESLVIAGWVVMWHPLEVLLYGLWPVIRERRLLERLAEAEIGLATPASATTVVSSA
jgi:hypothetical protein